MRTERAASPISVTAPLVSGEPRKFCALTDQPVELVGGIVQLGGELRGVLQRAVDIALIVTERLREFARRRQPRRRSSSRRRPWRGCGNRQRPVELVGGPQKLAGQRRGVGEQAVDMRLVLASVAEKKPRHCRPRRTLSGSTDADDAIEPVHHVGDLLRVDRLGEIANIAERAVELVGGVVELLGQRGVGEQAVDMPLVVGQRRREGVDIRGDVMRLVDDARAPCSALTALTRVSTSSDRLCNLLVSGAIVRPRSATPFRAALTPEELSASAFENVSALVSVSVIAGLLSSISLSALPISVVGLDRQALHGLQQVLEAAKARR